MATTDDKPAAQDSQVWHLDHSERRLLFITVVGGLAANIGLVLVVGLSLLIVHQLRSSHTGFVGLVDAASSVGTFAVALALVAAMLSRKHRLNKVFWAFTWVTVLAVAVIALAIVGYAAGIK